MPGTLGPRSKHPALPALCWGAVGTRWGGRVTQRLSGSGGDPVACSCVPAPAGMEGWKSRPGTEEVEGWGFFVSERKAGPCSPPPTAPISSLHLHSSGSQGFWQAFHSSFYWFQLSCPFRRVGKLQSLKENKKKKKENPSCSLTLLPSLPTPTIAKDTSPMHAPHSTAPYFPSQTQGFQALDTSNCTCWALITFLLGSNLERTQHR